MKIAVVTGAGSGIGRAVALGLAREGSRVVAADRDGKSASGTALAGGAEPGGDAITARQVDVSRPEEVAELGRWVLDELGAPDIVVNAAGWDRTTPFLETDADFARQIVDINYLGPVWVCRALAPAMVETGNGGSIVNIASDAGRVGSSGETIYAGAKGGVIALTKSLARELARYRIRVNCVCPGPTDTPLFAAQSEGTKESLIKAIPFRRLGRPEEVADAVLFFASDTSTFVTGQVLSVSGGLTMAG